MLKMFVLLLLLCTSTSSYKFLPDAVNRPSYSHFKNKHVVKVHEVPHQVLVVYDNDYCSGSLIFSRIVLTTASCFNGKIEKCSVKVGADTISSMGQIIPVIEKKIHEYYNQDIPLNNDIALLITERNVVFGPNIKKVIIVEPDVTVRVGTIIDVFGYGSFNHNDKFIDTLVLSDMKVLPDQECHTKYGALKTSSKYCARYQPERRLFDNGGAALYRHHSLDIVVGILSYGGPNIAENDSVALLTNVSYFHRWIMINSQRLLKKHCVEKKTFDASYEFNETMEVYEV